MSVARSPQAVPQGLAREPDPIAARYDLWLGGVAIILISLGLVMVASSSISTADRESANPCFTFSAKGCSWRWA